MSPKGTVSAPGCRIAERCGVRPGACGVSSHRREGVSIAVAACGHALARSRGRSRAPCRNGSQRWRAGCGRWPRPMVRG